VLAPQVLVDCVKNDSNGCHGGNPHEAYAWVAAHGVTDETCAAYQAKDMECSAINFCKTCDPSKVAKRCLLF
jgi:hypothetical protein